MSTTTPSTRRTLTRPRASLVNKGINTASSPNLNASYNALQTSLSSRILSHTLPRKSSLSALTQHSLSTISDASEGYGLSTVLDEDSPTMGSMPPFSPPRGAQREDLEVGDLVNVPGSMHGTVKFIGTIPGKKGTFAGVELSEEFADGGKNNGDVDG